MFSYKKLLIQQIYFSIYQKIIAISNRVYFKTINFVLIFGYTLFDLTYGYVGVEGGDIFKCYDLCIFSRDVKVICVKRSEYTQTAHVQYVRHIFIITFLLCYSLR